MLGVNLACFFCVLRGENGEDASKKDGEGSGGIGEIGLDIGMEFGI
jgi:hypothetical protein